MSGQRIIKMVALTSLKKQLIGSGFTWISSSKVCTGPGKPGKAENYIVAFSRTGKFWKKATGSGKFWKSVNSTKCLKHQPLNRSLYYDQFPLSTQLKKPKYYLSCKKYEVYGKQ